MHFITVECDIATLTLSNGEIHTYDYYEGDELLYSYCFVVECNYSVINLTNGDIQADRYYGGDNLLYSCDDGYTKTTDPVCTQSGNWSHDPGCSRNKNGKLFLKC